MKPIKLSWHSKNKKKMPLDDYIFYMFLVLFLVISIFNIVTNILTSYPASANVKWLLGIVLCTIGIVLVERKWWIEGYKTFVFAIVLSCVIFPSWFYGGGDNTFTLMYLLVLTVQALLMFRTKLLRLLFISLCTGMGITFVVVNHYFAHLIHPTQGQNVFADSMIQIIIIFSITAISAATYTSSYREQNKLLEKMAYEDALSGVYNRRKIIEKLEQNYESQHQPVKYLLMLDIDYFKAINDKYGHLVGDNIITSLGKNLNAAAAGAGFVGRYGGDEFLVLLHCDRAGLLVFVNNLLDRVNRDSLQYTLSIGVCEVSAGKTTDELISSADEMLYTAKERGRSRVYFWDATEVFHQA